MRFIVLASVLFAAMVAANPLNRLESRDCNCNEDGCTPDSPPCCANGTCLVSKFDIPRLVLGMGGELWHSADVHMTFDLLRMTYGN
ncbi:hypothetical protein AOQ84DRAFT_373854 [Glonium stellatum]|uniref:Uncharacterized protein n=1 Tax=Glonium stellatum TaxID=574774 RepID=A0A8E2F7V3_9PEZI|nr:hypothetical protein AOQ84DRAFT_373854 [Glonium stellatum]